MPTVRTFICLLLAAAILMGLVSCSKKKTKHEEAGNPTSATPLPSDGTDHSLSFFDESKGETEETTVPPVIEPEEPVEEAEEEQPLPEYGEIALGAVKGNTYRNRWIGIECTLESEWTCLTYEQYMEEQGEPVTYTDRDELQDILSHTGMYTELFASSEDGEQFVIISVENMEMVYGRILPEDAYFEQVYGKLEEAFASEMLGEFDIQETTVFFAGKERRAYKTISFLPVGNTSEALYFYDLTIPIRVDNHMISVTMSSSFTDTTREMASWFHAM